MDIKLGKEKEESFAKAILEGVATGVVVGVTFAATCITYRLLTKLVK